MCTENDVLDVERGQKSGLLSISQVAFGQMVRLFEPGYITHGNVYLKTTADEKLLVNLTNRGMSHIGGFNPDRLRFAPLAEGETFTLTQE